MNDSHVENLLRVIALRSEPVAPAGPRGSRPAADFGDQLFRLSPAPAPKRANDALSTPDTRSRRPPQESRDSAATNGQSVAPAADAARRSEDNDDRHAESPAAPPATDAPPWNDDAPVAAADEPSEPASAAAPSDATLAAAGATSAADAKSADWTEQAPTAKDAVVVEKQAATESQSVGHIGLSDASIGAAPDLPTDAEAGDIERNAAPGESNTTSPAAEATPDVDAAAINTAEIDDAGERTAHSRIAQAKEISAPANAPLVAEAAAAELASLDASDPPPSADSRDSRQQEDAESNASSRRDAHTRQPDDRSQAITVPSPAATDPSAAVPKVAVDEVSVQGAADDQKSHAVSDRQARLPAHVGRAARGAAVTHGRPADGEGELSRADAERFVGRVSRAFHFAQERGGTLRLRLSPPELGSLRLELNIHEGALSANLEAETPAARRLLLDHLPALRDRLAEQNIRVEKFDVDIRRDGQDGQTGPEQQQQGSQQRPQERTHHVPKPTASTPAARDLRATAPTAVPTITDSAINLVV